MQENACGLQQIFIDATYTITSGRTSGIERVVRKLLAETQHASVGMNLPQPQLVVNVGGRFYVANASFIKSAKKLSTRHADIVGTTSSFYRRLADAACRITRSAKLRKWLLPQVGHLGAFKLPHAMHLAAIRRRLVRETRPLEAAQGDLIFLPDAYWSQRLHDSVWPAVAAARRRGAFVSTLLFDIIPLTHPEFVGSKRCKAFGSYLLAAATNSDMLLAISQTVQSQVRELLPKLFEDCKDLCQDIRSFELGAEVQGAVPAENASVREHIRSAFAGSQAPYLMVASFDPRKNHAYLLDAFDRLWQGGHQVRLCLVGRIGARCEALIERIRHHAELGKRLFLFEDLDDSELQVAYRLSRGVVFPSIVEGYGLPIVESLWFRKKTFVSDTPIHREVGREDCTYFDLTCPNSLVQQIIAWESTNASGQTPALPTRRPTTWRESSHQALQACVDSVRLQRATSIETLGRAA